MAEVPPGTFWVKNSWYVWFLNATKVLPMKKVAVAPVE